MCPICYTRNLQYPTGLPVCRNVPPEWAREVFQTWIDISLVLYGLRLSTYLHYDTPVKTKKHGTTTITDMLKMLIGTYVVDEQVTNSSITASQVAVDRVDAKFVCHWDPVKKLHVCWDCTVVRIFIQVNTTNDLRVHERFAAFSEDQTMDGLRHRLVTSL